jgi:hypothetical protein
MMSTVLSSPLKFNRHLGGNMSPPSLGLKKLYFNLSLIHVMCANTIRDLSAVFYVLA